MKDVRIRHACFIEQPQTHIAHDADQVVVPHARQHRQLFVERGDAVSLELLHCNSRTAQQAAKHGALAAAAQALPRRSTQRGAHVLARPHRELGHYAALTRA